MEPHPAIGANRDHLATPLADASRDASAAYAPKKSAPRPRIGRCSTRRRPGFPTAMQADGARLHEPPIWHTPCVT